MNASSLKIKSNDPSCQPGNPYERVERARFNAAVITELVAEDAATFGRERAMEIWAARIIEVSAQYRDAMKAANAAAVNVIL